MVLAVEAYDWLKAAHVLASVMWVGGAVMLTLLGLMTIGLRDPIRLASSPADREVQGLIGRILLVARLDAVLLLFVVFDMTAKPWS